MLSFFFSSILNPFHIFHIQPQIIKKIDKKAYLKIINDKIDNISEKELLNLFKNNNITINEIHSSIDDNDNETSIMEYYYYSQIMKEYFKEPQ